MARAGTGFNDWNDTAPLWIGYFIDQYQLMPAGGKIDPTGFTPDEHGRVYIPSGTIVGRTAAQVAADAPFCRAAVGDEQVYIVAYEVRDAKVNNDIELVRPHAGVIVKWNFLPDQVHFNTMRDALLAQGYNLVRGV